MDALWRSRDAIRVKIWNWDQPTDPLCVCTQGRFWRCLSIWKEKYHIEGWFSDESKIAWLSKIELSIFKDSSPLKVSLWIKIGRTAFFFPFERKSSEMEAAPPSLGMGWTYHLPHLLQPNIFQLNTTKPKSKLEVPCVDQRIGLLCTRRRYLLKLWRRKILLLIISTNFSLFCYFAHMIHLLLTIWQ